MTPLSKTLQGLTNSTYGKMINSFLKPAASFFDDSVLVSHLGSREKCLDLQGTSYCVVPIQIKSLSKEGLHAMCLPTICTNSDVAWFVEGLNHFYRTTILDIATWDDFTLPSKIMTVDMSGKGIVCETK